MVEKLMFFRVFTLFMYIGVFITLILLQNDYLHKQFFLGPKGPKLWLIWKVTRMKSQITYFCHDLKDLG